MTGLDVLNALKGYYPNIDDFGIDSVISWTEWVSEESAGFIIIFRDTRGRQFMHADGVVDGGEPGDWNPERIFISRGFLPNPYYKNVTNRSK